MQSAQNNKLFSNVIPAATSHSKLNDADYLAVMCHEIGTPLTAIVGLTHIISSVECSHQKKRECAEMLRDSSLMLMDLLKDLLDSSKLESGRMEIEHTRFSLTKVIEEVVHIATFKAEQKGLPLHVHIGGGLPNELIGDPLRIRQIALNLLINAIKFTHTGQVSLYVNASGESSRYCTVSITVADGGNGMSESEIAKIFDKYAQANASVSRNYGGTGLGLSISQDLAHLMHGNITVKSWPGIGSHFIVTLPLQKVSPCRIETSTALLAA